MESWWSVVVLVAAVVVEVGAVEVGNYKAHRGMKFQGTLLHSLKVGTVVRCGALCRAVSCPGFHLQVDNSQSVSCSVFSSVTSYTENVATTTYYDQPPEIFKLGSKVMLPYPKNAPSLTWAAAKAWCSERDMQVFIPSSSADWTWMSEQAVKFSYGHTLIPVNDIAIENTLRWDDGSSAVNTPVIKWVSDEYMDWNTDLKDCVRAHLTSSILRAHMDACSVTGDGFFCVL